MLSEWKLAWGEETVGQQFSKSNYLDLRREGDAGDKIELA